MLKGKKLNINTGDIDKYWWKAGNSFCNKKIVMNVY